MPLGTFSEVSVIGKRDLDESVAPGE